MMNHSIVNNADPTQKSSVFESSTETASVRLSAGVRKFTGFESDSESEEEQPNNEDKRSVCKTSLENQTSSVHNSIVPATKDEALISVVPTEATAKNESSLFVSKNNILKKVIHVDEPTHTTYTEQLEESDEDEYIIHVDDTSNTLRDANKIGKVKLKQTDKKCVLNSPAIVPSHSAPQIDRLRGNSFGTDVKVIHGNKLPSPENYGSQFEYHDRQGVKVSGLLKGNASTVSTSYPPSSSSLSVVADAQARPANNQYLQERINPFNKDMHTEDDHFSDIADNFFKNQHALSSDSNQSPVSGSDTWTDMGSRRLSGLSDFEDITNADLGLAEDHFSQPDGHFGLSSTEELDLAIENCVEIIKMVPQNSDKQKNLVQKLVQLRMKRQELKDGPEPTLPDIKVVVGHKFKERNSRSSKHYCEKCNGVIWGVLQEWYRCTECGYCCHAKCLISITRTCARVKVKANPTYCLSICPKKGLNAQNYRCAECKSPISFKSGSPEPRLCDYSGNYYCEFCHWNDLMVIPARVLHNWDFETRKVCRASKQFLRLMLPYAAIRIQDINPMLFNFVEELSETKKLREELLVMKKYLLLCPDARKNKLLLLIKSRQHFIDGSDIYSMKDLMDIQTDVLLSELASVHSCWAQHVKSECELCQGRGFICGLCNEKDVLFPFDSHAVVCSQCSNVMHRHCYANKGVCPRCERRDRRKGN